MNCSRNDEKWISMALSEAEKSNMPMRHGCLAVSGGKIVAKGYNSYRTYSRDGMIRNTCSCHAEIDVLRKCLKKEKNKLSLYIVRVSSEGILRNSSPCHMCISVMKYFPIKRIIFSTDDGITKCKLSEYTNTFHTSGDRAIRENRANYYKTNTFSYYNDNKIYTTLI